jgi:hypothetical protein
MGTVSIITNGKACILQVFQKSHSVRRIYCYVTVKQVVTKCVNVKHETVNVQEPDLVAVCSGVIS